MSRGNGGASADIYPAGSLADRRRLAYSTASSRQLNDIALQPDDDDAALVRIARLHVNGQFIEPGKAGDRIRKPSKLNPESLPTGLVGPHVPEHESPATRLTAQLSARPHAA